MIAHKDKIIIIGSGMIVPDYLLKHFHDEDIRVVDIDKCLAQLEAERGIDNRDPGLMNYEDFVKTYFPDEVQKQIDFEAFKPTYDFMQARLSDYILEAPQETKRKNNVPFYDGLYKPGGKKYKRPKN